MFLQCVLLLIHALCMCSGSLEYRNDYTYYPKANGWFKVHYMPAITWYDANDICHNEGAELVSPLNENIMSVVQELVDKTEPKPAKGVYFSGVHNTFAGNLFTSVGGIPLENFQQHIKWDVGKLNNNVKDIFKCLVYSANGMWVYRVDEFALPFICYREFRETELTDCGTVDTEYILSKRTGNCYKHHHEGATWSRAQETCQAEGGYLAIVNSETEAKLLMEIVSESPSPIHVRFSDNTLLMGFLEWGQKYNWRTIHGETLKQAGFNQWALEHLTDERSCGGFTDGKLDSVRCSEPYAYICEKTIHSLTNSTSLNNSLHSRL